MLLVINFIYYKTKLLNFLKIIEQLVFFIHLVLLIKQSQVKVQIMS